MLELTGVASILRGMSFLYWIAAIVSLVFVVWKVKRWAYKAIGIAAVIGLFGYLPAQAWVEARKRETYTREAWAYFKKLCDEKSGEKIYKTFTGVKSVLVVKPLPPATEKDLYDQFWYGDPYSSTSTDDRASYAAYSLLAAIAGRDSKGKIKGFDFVEEVRAIDKTTSRTIRYTLTPTGRTNEAVLTESASRFGIAWEDISTPEDRKYWVAGSRLRITNVTDNSLVAERIGYFIESGFGSTAGQRRPWLTSRGPGTTCPKIERSFDEDRFFIQKVLNPATENSNGK